MADEPQSDRAAALARGLLQIADAAGMPDAFWQTDSRVKLAREVLGIPEDGRYTHADKWEGAGMGYFEEPTDG